MQILITKFYSGRKIEVFTDSAGDLWYVITWGGYQLIEALAFDRHQALAAAKRWIDSQ